MDSSPWRWPNDGVLSLCLAALRACALWPWLELLRRWLSPAQPAPLLPLPLLVALTLASTVIARRSLAAHRDLFWPRLAVALGGLAATLAVLWCTFFRTAQSPWKLQWIVATGQWLLRWNAGVPAPLIVTLSAAYLWLRGILDGRAPLHSDDAWGAFRGGSIALALAAIAANLDGRGVPPGTTQIVIVFFAAGMGALAVTGLQLARGSALSKAEASLATNRYWAGTLGLVVVGLLALGVALSFVVAPEDVAQALRWTSAVLDFLGRLLYALLLAVAYLAFLVLEPLFRALKSMLSSRPVTEPQVPDLQSQFEDLAKGSQGRALLTGIDLRWLAIAAFVAVIALVFALALRRFWTAQGDEVKETRETVLSRRLLQEQLAALWRRWARWPRGTAMRRGERYLPLEGETWARRLIRTTYRAFLSAAASLGYTRSRSQTPAELARVVSERWPAGEGFLGTITSGYERARYGSEAPSSEDVRLVREAWEQLEAMLKNTGDVGSPLAGADEGGMPGMRKGRPA